MATGVPCIIATTVIVVSLANLLLLVHVIMQSLRNCDDFSSKNFDNIRRDDSSENWNDHQVVVSDYKFMAAIISIDDNDIDFVCGVAIISKNWVLTSAHCAEIAADHPRDNLKISCNSSKIKYGIWHDINKIIVHENYDKFRRYNDISLISTKQPFKAKYATPVALAGSKFKYVANTTGTTLGWGSQDLSQRLYGMEVKLFWYKNCEEFYPDEGVVENSMFCAGTVKKRCVSDEGGQLMVKNILIGLIAIGGGCNSENKPEVYLKLGVFENWIKKAETNGLKAVFKSKI